MERAAPQDGQGFSRGAVYHLLRAGFGLEEFRPGQADVVRAIGNGRPAIAVMPTGGGKSLCYQLPAALLPGTSLVISPLISLMRDQVLALRARGYAAGHLDSTQDLDERRAVEEALVQGRLKLLYVSPDGRMMAVEVSVEDARLEVGLPVALFAGVNATPTTDHFAVTADGQRFLLTVPVEDDSGARIHVVLNWPALLANRVRE